MPNQLNLFIETFGCQMNAADSEEMAGGYFTEGFLVYLTFDHPF